MDTLRFPITSYLILGSLTFREMSGYDLKALLDRSIRHFYMSPAQSQIYAELRRLESHDLVTMRRVIQEQRPDKRLYRITPKGRAVIDEWLGEAKVKADTYKSPFQLRMFFGHLLPRERQLSLVRNQQRFLIDAIMVLEEREEDLRNRLQGAELEEDLFYPHLLIELKLASFRAELEWADRVMQKLTQQHREDAVRT